MYESVLEAIAGVGVAVAGFSGVVFVLGDRAGRDLKARERSGLFHLLFTSFGAVMISLILNALLSSDLDESGIWRTGCAITGIWVLVGASRAIYEEFGKRHSLRGSLAWLSPLGAIPLAAINLIVAAGFYSDFAPLVCLALLIYILLVSMMYFVSLLIPE